MRMGEDEGTAKDVGAAAAVDFQAGEATGVPERVGEAPGFEQPDSGLRRTLVLRSQADPSQVFVLVLFDSEEKARARQQDPRRREGLERLTAALPGVLDGPPEFFELDVATDSPGPSPD